MRRVIAITENEMILCFEDKVPTGAQVIDGPQALEAYPIEYLDEARAALLKSKVSRSSSVGGAANLLWGVLKMFADDKDAVTGPFYVCATTKSGAQKVRRGSRNLDRVYELNYFPGRDLVKDNRKKKLKVQMNAIIDLLVEGGRTHYTEREVLEILDANRERVGTTRSTDNTFYYLRGRLRGFGFLLYRDAE